MTSAPPRAIGLVCASAVLWGLYWMPVRALNNFGIDGIWTAVLLAFAGFIASLPFLATKKIGIVGWQHLVGALGIGSAFALYGIALSYTDIVRVVLLFYLAPAWSIILECIFFNRKLTIRSLLSLLFSFTGIIVIFKGDLPIDGLGALGDWLALLAGLGWSTGSALMFSSRKISVPAMTTASFAGAIAVASICLLLIGEPTSSSPFILIDHWQWLLLVCVLLGVFYLVPVAAITLWGATQIPPATMSFLLTVEVIAAVGSSALLLGESFGTVELIGTALIIAGAMAEITR